MVVVGDGSGDAYGDSGGGVCVGGVGGCRCVLELERQDKVCMYIENEVGLGGTSGLKSQLTLYFHWRKKNTQTFKIKTNKLLKTSHFHQYIS